MLPKLCHARAQAVLLFPNPKQLADVLVPGTVHQVFGQQHDCVSHPKS